MLFSRCGGLYGCDAYAWRHAKRTTRIRLNFVFDEALRQLDQTLKENVGAMA
jgi:hypothetical protein